MVIKKIELNNFKNFAGKHSFSVSKLNIIKGSNGSGKTTIAVDSLLFALYGYSVTTLSQLANRNNKTQSFNVIVELEDEGEEIKIIRKYPTHIEIFLNGTKVNFSHSKEAQEWLNKRFKNVDYFRKFRMVDNSVGINILESGSIALKKTLLDLVADKFNSVRKKLLEEKSKRETYNKDNLKISIHYPSEKRLNLLKKYEQDIYSQLSKLSSEINHQNSIIYELSSKIGGSNKQINYFKSQINKLKGYNICPVCKQQITKEHKDNIIKETESKINKLIDEANNINEEIEIEKMAFSELNNVRNNLQLKARKVIELSSELRDRIKLKDYIYTTKDIEVVKRAVKELDNFYSYYITEWVKTLEPLINNITEKIGFIVYFDIDDKGKFKIILEKNGIKYNYKDLSLGQKLILSIAFKLAILLERGESGVIVADEGFSSLDDENLDHIFGLFATTPFQLICILHRLDNIPSIVNVIEL